MTREIRLPITTTLKVLRPLRVVNKIRQDLDNVFQVVELNRDICNAVFRTNHGATVTVMANHTSSVVLDPGVSFLIDQAQHEVAILARIALVMKLLSLSYHHIVRKRKRNM
jgi:hypothetical protein